MKNMLYKEFRLTISPLFYLFMLFGALLLIPQWLYFVALMYFFFIAVPNILTTAKAQGDIDFSASLPVRRSDIVNSRIMSVVILELLQIIATSIFAVINLALYPQGNFLLDTNAAFIGFAFIMYGIHNVILFPMFYKTAYKIAVPTFAAITVSVLFAGVVETAVQVVPFLRVLDGRQDTGVHLAVLFGGIIIFALLNVLAAKMSVKRFERVNI
jgi:hypothetical protein